MSQLVPILQAIEASQLRDVPTLRIGSVVRVHYRIREGEKERVQVFQGTIIRKSHGGLNASFCVRKVSYGVGVERTFPVHSPRIEKIETVSISHVRRARLYYLRHLSGKKARLKDATRHSQHPQAEKEPTS